MGSFSTEAVVLNSREFNDFVGGYMEYWNLPPKDSREAGQYNKRDITSVPFGKNGMRIHLVSEPNEMGSGSFDIFEVDLKVYDFFKFCPVQLKDTWLNFKEEDTCGNPHSSKLYIIIVRKNETMEDVKLKLCPYMPSDFDLDAHSGHLLLE